MRPSPTFTVFHRLSLGLVLYALLELEVILVGLAGERLGVEVSDSAFFLLPLLFAQFLPRLLGEGRAISAIFFAEWFLRLTFGDCLQASIQLLRNKGGRGVPI